MDNSDEDEFPLSEEQMEKLAQLQVTSLFYAIHYKKISSIKIVLVVLNLSDKLFRFFGCHQWV
jgi:hypothetical protein